MDYVVRVVTSIDREFVLLKHVESVKLNNRDSEAGLYEELSGDNIFTVTTLSGNVHQCSVSEVKHQLLQNVHDKEKTIIENMTSYCFFVEYIYNSWLQ